jgi:hypothetical protein
MRYLLLSLLLFLLVKSGYCQNAQVPDSIGYKIVNKFMEAQQDRRIGLECLRLDMDSNAYTGNYPPLRGCGSRIKLKHSVKDLTAGYSQNNIEKQVSTLSQIWDKDKISFRVLHTNKPLPLFFIYHIPINDFLQIFNTKTIYKVSWPIRLDNNTFAIQFYTIKRQGIIKSNPKLAFVDYQNNKLTILKVAE